jgi:uncharacterized membrane protein SpoIIM required for sporulation
MWRLARWSRSVPALVGLNTGLVLCAVSIGWQVSDARYSRFEVRPPSAVHAPAVAACEHTARILAGNLRVMATLLAGVCTLGLLTLWTLLSNAFVLGFGLSALARGMPEAMPLAARYVLLEFSAFVVAASVAEHLSFTVLRYLAIGTPPRFKADLVGLATAVAMLVVAAIVEADVTRLIILLTA